MGEECFVHVFPVIKHYPFYNQFDLFTRYDFSLQASIEHHALHVGGAILVHESLVSIAKRLVHSCQ